MLDLKKVFVLGTLGFIVVCLALFYVLTSSVSSRSLLEHENKVEYAELESKLKHLEEAVLTHRKSLNDLNRLILDEKGNALNILGPLVGNSGHDELLPGLDSAGQCSAAVGIQQAKSDVNMLNVYDLLKFDNPDGGVWKQGWNIEANLTRFTAQNKLKVFVIPHSHNDPGWIKTFERYFADQTKHILDSMLREMRENTEVKFIWAEISYFSLWWDGLGSAEKAEIKSLTNDGRLEFVTGGWVMPDEAGSHYFSIISQLIEGHQWLFHHLKYIPRNGWSIDPFGMSPTNAYLIKKSGLKNMLIQRTHYSVKKELSRVKGLEFNWRQSWDSQGTSDILCHMMPFYSYDVPHTCGPEPRVCCQYDFKRMSSVSHMSCPWGIQPRPIPPADPKTAIGRTQTLERSLPLLDQYRKKAELYQTNVLLVPLGDDFRWEDSKEWAAQTENYKRIMDAVNNEPELNAEIKFATLDDYFAALQHEIEQKRFTPKALTGDFFTYADRDDHYWSGYFTSRPFHKAMDRELMRHLRAAHILYTLMSAEIYGRKNKENPLSLPFVKELLGHLIHARRMLSLFQHHDGVTGTSKDHVMVDYGKKLLSSLASCNHVMQQSLQVLTHLNDKDFDIDDIKSDTVFFDASQARDTQDTLPQNNLIVLDQEVNKRLVTVFNSVARKRSQLVRLYVSTYNVKVYDRVGGLVDSEILPVFEGKTVVRRNVFELNFVAELGSLGVANFLLKLENNDERSHPQLFFMNPSTADTSTHNAFPVKIVTEDDELEIGNDKLKLAFDKNGFTKSVTVDGATHPIRISMNHYGARHTRETSGLYLFLPDGPAKKIDLGKPFVRIVKGKFQQFAEVWLEQIKHRVTLYNHPGYEKHAIEVRNVVDIRRERDNFELMMKFETNVASGSVFYTDLNGFQMIKRKRFDKIPLQGHYYPLPTAAYIEDPNLRFTILSGQPLGASSLGSGEFEIVMDRRLNQDDNRGAGQGAQDNLETENVFRILFEVPHCQDKNRDEVPPMLSLQSQILLEDLLHPLQSFVAQTETSDATMSALADYSVGPGSTSLTCDLQLVDMSPLPSYEDYLDDHSFQANPLTGILVRRLGYDGQFIKSIPLPECVSAKGVLGEFKPKDLFGDLIEPELEERKLTFVEDETEPIRKISSSEGVLLKPMEINGFLARFRKMS